jgi:hypothetical protein
VGIPHPHPNKDAFYYPANALSSHVADLNLDDDTLSLSSASLCYNYPNGYRLAYALSYTLSGDLFSTDSWWPYQHSDSLPLDATLNGYTLFFPNALIYK